MASSDIDDSDIDDERYEDDGDVIYAYELLSQHAGDNLPKVDDLRKLTGEEGILFDDLNQYEKGAVLYNFLLLNKPVEIRIAIENSGDQTLASASLMKFIKHTWNTAGAANTR